MNEIKQQINELFRLGGMLVDYKHPEWIKRHNQAINAMTVLMDKIKEVATANNTILGRSIFLPHADGNAMYVVTKINKRSVRLEHCPWIDNWYDNVLGEGGTVSLEWAENEIRGRDEIAKLFPARPFNLNIFER